MTATLDPAATATNPFVGPRSIRYGERLFGRDRESREILDLLLAHRILLLYSPSGAGKTSLLEAGLVDGLEVEGIEVPRYEGLERTRRPVLVRVGTVPPAGAATANRYVVSTVLALDESRPPERRTPESDLGRIKLADYLDRWQAERGGHFAAWEEPQLFAEEIRAAFRSLR